MMLASNVLILPNEVQHKSISAKSIKQERGRGIALRNRFVDSRKKMQPSVLNLRRMGENKFDFIRMGFRTGCPKFGAGILIWSHLGALPGLNCFVILFWGALPVHTTAAIIPTATTHRPYRLAGPQREDGKNDGHIIPAILEGGMWAKW